MACYVYVLTVCLLVLWPAQPSHGDIIELKNFKTESLNYVDVTFERGNAANDYHLTSKRQTGGDQPQIDGEHEFMDGYRHGRVHYSGENSDVIIVLTYDLRNDASYLSNLYRSTDYGHSFTNINEKVQNATLYQTFFANGADRNLLIFVHTSEPQLYYSLDEGASFTTVDLVPDTLDTHTIVYHPSRDGWMLMLSDDSRLYVTKNYGSSWSKVAENVNTYQWSDAKWDDDDRKIYYTTKDSQDPDLYDLYTSDFPYSAVMTKEFDTTLGNHDGFLLVGRYIFAQHTDEGGEIALYVSDQRKPFQKARIPTPEAHQSYLVTDINEMQALVIVEHEGDFYNLYLSDESGIYYSLSLRDIVIETTPNLQVDLELIDGVNGTLIANQYTREDPFQDASLIRTLITLDNGGFWEALLPPDEDVNGDAVNCEPPECSLHLHMDTTSYSRLGVYSTESAPGIIVAHGNTGDKLSNDPDLYISRDGGVTWEEILAGSWGVNVADHGGLMVAAKDYHEEQSMVLKYSCDEGYSWKDFMFIDFNFTVFGVITEPGQHTTIVSLYGGSGVPFEWTVVTVDFASIFPRECEDDDYYDWKPWDVRSESDCILGSTITIERRKPQVCCLNGRDYDREFDFTICECTSEDFECDYGYARPSHDLNAPCMRDADITLPNPCADGKTKTYMASTGYRKVAGDVCVKGEESLFNHFEAPCCGNTTLPPFPYLPPTGNTDKNTAPEDEEEEGVPTVVVIVIAVLLALACLAAVVFLALFLTSALKYKTMRQRYIRFVTAGEPELQSYTAGGAGGRETSPEDLAPGVGDEEDDKPLVP